MFTIEQLHEYFADRYTPEQVNRALQIFKENGADIDIESGQFSLEITEELEGIFKAVGTALDNQKKLGQADETLTVLEAQTLASKYTQHSSPKLIAAMVRLVTEEAIELGSLLTQIKSDALGKTLEQGNLEIARSLFNGTRQATNYVRQLSQDDEKRNKMLIGYGVEPVDIEAFFDEVRASSQGVKDAVKAIKPAKENIFDMEAFLLEAGE